MAGSHQEVGNETKNSLQGRKAELELSQCPILPSFLVTSQHIPGLGQTADEVEGSRGQVAFMLGVSCVCLCLPCFLPLPLTVPHSVDKSFLHPSGVQRWQEL